MAAILKTNTLTDENEEFSCALVEDGDLKSHDYKLTNEIEEFRSDLVEDGDLGSRDSYSHGADDVTSCGIGGCHPAFLQPFAKIGFFTGFYSLAGLMTSTLSVYVNSQVTTLERQFGFSSKQTGLIMAANDMGFLIFVLFVSYLANMVHIPRALAMTTIIYGISGLVCALPHFLYKDSINIDLSMIPDMTSDPLVSNQSIALGVREQAIHGQLCQYENRSVLDQCQMSDSKTSQEAINQQAVMSSLIIIVIGMMLQGMGKAPRSAFVVIYLDNNTKHVNTGFFLGIIIAFSILGPALAFGMGGIFTRMYVTLEETNLNPKHPLWIGAWWLGYVAFGAVAIFVSLPLFCMPRRLPRKSQSHDLESRRRKPIYKGKETVNVSTVKSDSTTTTTTTTTTTSQSAIHNGKHNGEIQGKELQRSKSVKAINSIKQFVSSLLRLWSNPVYMLIVMSNSLIIFTVSGTSAYTPKYLERIFDLPAHKANYIMAGKTLTASCVGTFVGGYLSKRWKLTALSALKFTIAVVFTSTIFIILSFFFYCDQPETHNYPWVTESCVSDCQCDSDTYFPVCGADGRTFYSPCTAGCQSDSDGQYFNCTCIEGGMAHSGNCPYECDQVYYYAVVSGIRALTGTLSIIPRITILIRSVLARDKPLAMGFVTFMTSLFGWLLGPVIFGFVIDGICVIWDSKCDVTGRCLLYDNEMFRLRLHGFALMGQVGSFVCQVIALIYAKCTGCLDKEQADDSAHMQMEEVIKEEKRDDRENTEKVKAQTESGCRKEEMPMETLEMLVDKGSGGENDDNGNIKDKVDDDRDVIGDNLGC